MLSVGGEDLHFPSTSPIENKSPKPNETLTLKEGYFALLAPSTFEVATGPPTVCHYSHIDSGCGHHNNTSCTLPLQSSV